MKTAISAAISEPPAMAATNPAASTSTLVKGPMSALVASSVAKLARWSRGGAAIRGIARLDGRTRTARACGAELAVRNDVRGEIGTERAGTKAGERDMAESGSAPVRLG